MKIVEAMCGLCGINRRLEHIVLKMDQILSLMLCSPLPQELRGELAWATGKQPADEPPDARGVPRHFVFSSLFLRRAGELLMQQEEESLVFGSGVDLSEASVVDEIFTFDLEIQSIASAKGDFVDSTRALIDMSERGYVLRATMHCHPGHGEFATRPSLTDHDTHQRLEAGGYEAIGVIMTRDGHVRFFTDRLPFKVTVVGDDVDEIDEHTYRLLEDGGGDKHEYEPNEQDWEVYP